MLAAKKCIYEKSKQKKIEEIKMPEAMIVYLFMMNF